MSDRGPKFPRARSGADFRGQMTGYRTKNRSQPGVAEYEHRQREGYDAHVEGLWHQARSIDSPSTLPNGAKDPNLFPDAPEGTPSYSLGDIKMADMQQNYDRGYANRMAGAIVNRTADPIHVGPGKEIYPTYSFPDEEGPTVAETARQNLTRSEYNHDVAIGNGNHRLSLAHALGVQFIRAKSGVFGTGDQPQFGGTKKYGQARIDGLPD